MLRWPKTKSLAITSVVILSLLVVVALAKKTSRATANNQPPISSENLVSQDTDALSSEPRRIPKKSAEAYAAKQGQSAICLVALSRATGDPAWLQRAIAEHPEDPRVQLERWKAAQTPEEALSAIQALRQAAPGNPLGTYLEAGLAFEQGNLGAFANLMTDAEMAGSFNSYIMDMMLETQAAFSAGGFDEREAWAAAYRSEGAVDGRLPRTLEVLSRLGDQMGELQHVLVELGYWDDADFMFERTLALGEQLQSSDTFFENEEGIALQKKLLTGFDGETLVSDDGTRINQRLAELDEAMAQIRTIDAAISDETKMSLDAAGWARFNEIARRDGEVAAARWLGQRK